MPVREAVVLGVFESLDESLDVGELDLLDELSAAGLVEQDTAVVPSAKQCCVVA